MKRVFLLILILLTGAVLFFSLKTNNNKPFENSEFNIESVSENTFFELKKGDLLVRPNSDNLPGSIDISYGRMYGHVAIVTEGASGSN